MTTPVFAVIATRNRPEVLKGCLDSIYGQVDRIIVVDNGSEPSLTNDGDYSHVIIRRHDEQPPNLSRLWNIGLDEVHSWLNPESGAPWNVAVLNDDAIVPYGWFEAVSSAMRANGAAAGCSDPFGNLREPMMHTEPGPVGMATRMVGWAHMLAGEKGLRYDEDLRWWFGDDDMDWESRRAGGMIMVPGFTVENRFPNGQMTPELHEQTGRDRETFMRKWGGLLPW